MSEAVYRVLARKYRPTSFAELIGQEALVRTLSNAIASGRIAHAFVLTGVRGVGKTTTARIIARALNCVGPDGKGGPTAAPCGECEPCRAIAEDRHVDVMEMDAASRTGVDNIRELTDGVRYRPVSARFKIYIIDEVHMLSKAAFNALLKTLEEPPPEVKFIFATTEIQKVPVTVLSRCQRFSLRRVPADELAAHYARIARTEEVEAEPAALALIARAADGSVRDGLSLLDQAIALCAGAITEAAMRDMLGIADHSLLFDLLEAVLKGDAKAALGQMRALYEGGADPVVVLQDLLELTHFLTRLKLAPETGEGDPMAEGDRARGLPLSRQLGIPILARSWQILLKGLGEAQIAPSALQATEMVLIRLAYVADLPPPAELLRAVTERGFSGTANPASSPERPPASSPTASSPTASSPPASGGGAQAVAAQAAPRMAAGPEPVPRSFPEVIALFDRHREAVLRSHLWSHAHLVRFEPGRIELRLAEKAPRNLPNRLGELLGEWTGMRWIVSVSGETGDPTLASQAQIRDLETRNEVSRYPSVRAVLDIFPGATIEAVRERAAAGPESGGSVPADETPDEEDGQ